LYFKLNTKPLIRACGLKPKYLLITLLLRVAVAVVTINQVAVALVVY
jgi:hypothetical protein